MSFRGVFIAIFIGTTLLVGAFLINARRPRVEVVQPSAALVRATGKCAECHRRETSAVVHEYELSRHSVAGINCLDCQFFDQQTLKNLVYTAPFAAPLAYAGVGLLLILDRMVDARSVEWARWVVLLALGGFIGNFVLSVTDHAQNGFFFRVEWISVASSAMAVGILVAVLLVYDNRPLLRLCAWVMGAQVVVGVLGALLHGRSNLARPRQSLWEGFLYGAPVFAPLLFADLAILAVLALWALERAMPVAKPVEASQPVP